MRRYMTIVKFDDAVASNELAAIRMRRYSW